MKLLSDHELMVWTIYCHTHIATGRRYIGLTSRTWQDRWKHHIHDAQRSKGGRWHFPNAIRKYGKDAFIHEVLEFCCSLEVANIAEESWIEFFNTRNPEKGFNLAKGGLHVPHPIEKPTRTPESISRRSLASKLALNTPESRARRSLASKLALNTPESKIKRSILSKMALNTPKSRAKRITSSSSESKICSKCRVEKHIHEFSKSVRGQFGVRKDCKSCVLQRQRSTIVILLPEDSRRMCTKCHIGKKITEFHRTRANRSGYRPECSECRRASARKYANDKYLKKKNMIDGMSSHLALNSIDSSSFIQLSTEEAIV